MCDLGHGLDAFATCLLVTIDVELFRGVDITSVHITNQCKDFRMARLVCCPASSAMAVCAGDMLIRLHRFTQLDQIITSDITGSSQVINRRQRKKGGNVTLF